MPDRRSLRLLLVLVLACGTLITLDAQGAGRSPFDPVRRAVAALLTPPEQALSSAVTAASAAGSALGQLGSDEVSRLREENARLRAELVRQEAAGRRLAEWDALMQLKDVRGYTLVPARVVSAGSALGFARTVRLDVGSADGVAPGQTVIAAAGLVGRTVRVGSWTSVVLLVDDPGFGAGARLGREGTLGLARGDGAGRMTYAQVHGGRVEVGEDVLTTGSDTFLPDVPVGRVTEAGTSTLGLTSTATVEPFADLAALDLVGVIVEPSRSTPRVPVPPATS